MKNIVLAAVAAVTLLTIMATVTVRQPEEQQNLTFSLKDDECTETMKAECAIDIERTAKNCAKAFATEGAGIISDIKCLKDLKADKAKCWPCLCEEAKEKGWHNLDC